MEQDVRERDAGCKPVWHREWHEDQDHEKHSEMLARVNEFNEDVDKLFAEYQQDIECGQLGECNQELKDCVTEPRRTLRRVQRQELLRSRVRVQVCLRGLFPVRIRVWMRGRLHAERDCCVMGNQDQTQTQHQRSIDNRKCEMMRVKIFHTSTTLNEVFGETQLTRGTLRTFAVATAKTKQFYL